MLLQMFLAKIVNKRQNVEKPHLCTANLLFLTSNVIYILKKYTKIHNLVSPNPCFVSFPFVEYAKLCHGKHGA